MQEPTMSIFQALCTPYFIVTFLVNLVLTAAVNFGIDYLSATRFSDVLYAMDWRVVLNMLAFYTIMTSILQLNRFPMHQRLRAGKARPIAQRALCDTALKRTIFFALPVPQWKRRWPRMILNAVAFPGGPLGFLWAALCASDAFVGRNGAACVVDAWGYAGYAVAWKSVGGAVVFAMNYTAFLNDAQPELHADIEGGQGGAF